CRVDLWYFDQPVNYTINVTFGDVNGARTENSSTQLEFQQLTAVQISPASLTWPSIGVTSVNTSSNTALNISNTGNKNIANGSTTLTGIDLSGEITKIERIFVGNISVTHVPGFQCSNNNATLLFNNTAKPIRPNGTLARGNNSVNLGTLNATICLQSINASISAQKYSTNGSGPGQEWTVTIS
ncbi:hypothetical protein HY500_01930, partial [Candidatus Woesearchaeota archaeon]|nr:hypothetical protein [Candidatus Woesearchaeota archaeon]